MDDLNQSQSEIYIDTGLGSAANTVIGTEIEPMRHLGSP